MEKAELFAFLSKQRYGIISSLSAGGTPQSALVGIAVTPELEVIFDTLRATRKYTNLRAHPACSLAIGWDGEQTVQMDGRAAEPEEPELSHYLKLYLSAWPDCSVHLDWPGITHFVVRPDWIRYSDFDQKPPLIQEWNPGKEH